MICFPNAKINLGLNVIHKRSDGYHNIETIFYPIPIKDALEIVSIAEKDCLHQSGISIESIPSDNLVMKALQKLRKRFDIPPLEIHLLKGIPSGAGLGGGSSDAAHMLKLINDFISLGLSIDEMEEMATSLGADCPFFIRNKPVFASGIGNVFSPINLSLKGYYIYLIKPEIIVSTAKAYSLITPKSPTLSLQEIIQMPIKDWKDVMKNDFEESVFDQFPSIKEIKKNLYDNGAIYASMSGSGSSVFGIFDKEKNIPHLFPNCFIWKGYLS